MKNMLMTKCSHTASQTQTQSAQQNFCWRTRQVMR